MCEPGERVGLLRPAANGDTKPLPFTNWAVARDQGGQ